MKTSTRERKNARTRIYAALFGHGGKTQNVPWHDPSRSMPQDVDVQAIVEILDGPSWRIAAFDKPRAAIIVERLNTLSKNVHGPRYGLKFWQDGSFTVTPMEGR